MITTPVINELSKDLPGFDGLSKKEQDALLQDAKAFATDNAERLLSVSYDFEHMTEDGTRIEWTYPMGLPLMLELLKESGTAAAEDYNCEFARIELNESCSDNATLHDETFGGKSFDVAVGAHITFPAGIQNKEEAARWLSNLLGPLGNRHICFDVQIQESDD